MQQYISSFLILVLLLGIVIPIKSVADTNDFLLTVCEIIKSRQASVNKVYPPARNKEINTILTPENWHTFYGCLAETPFEIWNLQEHTKEPIRSAASTSTYFIDNLKAVREIVDFLNPQQKWKPDHAYIVIWLAYIPYKQTLSRFFKKVWQKNILNIVAALVSTQEIFTYEPFTEKGFQVQLLNHQPYFYDKLKNFHQFELRISMFNDCVRAVALQNFTTRGYKKVDGLIARTLVEHLNATARYITPNDNETYGALVNASFSGSLKDIQSGFTHIGFNHRFILDCERPFIEELYPYQKRLLYLIVPAAKIRPAYLIFANAFTYSLWRLLVLNFFIILLVFYVLQKLADHLSAPQKISNHWRWYELLEIFAKTQVREPVEGLSRISSLRQFFISWILFNYVLTSIYIAKLESSFVQPLYEPEMNNLRELSHLKVPIYAFDIIFEAVQKSLDPFHFQLISKNGVRIPRTIGTDDFYLTLAKKHKNMALIVRDELAKAIVAYTYNDEIKRPSFHIVKEYLRSFTVSYVLTKGSPFIEKFQSIVSALYEHGFITHWLDVDSQQRNYLHHSEEYLQHLENDFILENSDTGNGILSPSELSRNKVVLNLKILQGAFYLWFSGICLSLLSFGMEHLIWWYKKRP